MASLICPVETKLGDFLFSARDAARDAAPVDAAGVASLAFYDVRLRLALGPAAAGTEFRAAVVDYARRELALVDPAPGSALFDEGIGELRLPIVVAFSHSRATCVPAADCAPRPILAPPKAAAEEAAEAAAEVPSADDDDGDATDDGTRRRRAARRPRPAPRAITGAGMEIDSDDGADGASDSGEDDEPSSSDTSSTSSGSDDEDDYDEEEDSEDEDSGDDETKEKELGDAISGPTAVPEAIAAGGGDGDE